MLENDYSKYVRYESKTKGYAVKATKSIKQEVDNIFSTFN